MNHNEQKFIKNHALTAERSEIAKYMSSVYLWMTLGIFLTGIVAAFFASTPALINAIVTNKILFYGLIIAEFGLVIFISARIEKINSLTATGLFLLYSAINGATLSIIFLIYTSSSIASTFFITAIGFAGLSATGYITKKDLGPVGSFCSMGLWGLIGFSILSIFFPSMMGPATSKIFGLVGIIVFAGLTAYDTQAIKQMAPLGANGEIQQKSAIMGSLKLYLDFINLFLFMLRFMGNSRD